LALIAVEAVLVAFPSSSRVALVRRQRGVSLSYYRGPFAIFDRYTGQCAGKDQIISFRVVIDTEFALQPLGGVGSAQSRSINTDAIEFVRHPVQSAIRLDAGNRPDATAFELLDQS
jgi:hypothetical protein